MKKQPIVSAAKLRAIADQLERAAMREVGELRRLADLMDGVARVTRTKAKPAKKTAKKAAKTTARKTAKSAAKAKRAKRRRDPRQIDIEDLIGRTKKAAGVKARPAKAKARAARAR